MAFERSLIGVISPKILTVFEESERGEPKGCIKESRYRRSGLSFPRSTITLFIPPCEMGNQKLLSHQGFKT